MENVRLIVRNIFDEAGLAVTDQVTPIESLQQSRRTKWRSATNSTQIITGTLSDYAFSDGIAIAHHNLLAGAQWKLILKEDGVVQYDSDWLDTVLYIPAANFLPGITPWMASYNEKLPVQMMVHWFDITLCNEFEIHLKPEATETYVEVGRIFLGQAISPEFNMDFGCNLTYLEKGEHRESDAQGLWTIGKGVRRQFEMDFNLLDSNERSNLSLELVSKGIQQDILISGYPERGDVLELEHTLIGKRRDYFSSPHVDYDEWQTKLAFLET
ncbi:MAG: hypothetical protein ACRBB6_03105 [Neptuniibacter sp.]